MTGPSEARTLEFPKEIPFARVFSRKMNFRRKFIIETGENRPFFRSSNFYPVLESTKTPGYKGRNSGQKSGSNFEEIRALRAPTNFQADFFDHRKYDYRNDFRKISKINFSPKNRPPKNKRDHQKIRKNRDFRRKSPTKNFAKITIF